MLKVFLCRAALQPEAGGPSRGQRTACDARAAADATAKGGRRKARGGGHAAGARCCAAAAAQPAQGPPHAGGHVMTGVLNNCCYFGQCRGFSSLLMMMVFLGAGDPPSNSGYITVI
jgi:hypothetical protein